MAILTKEQIAEFATALVAVSEVPVTDGSEQYAFGDFDGVATFLADLNETVTSLEGSITNLEADIVTLTGEKAVLQGQLTTASGTLEETERTVADLMLDLGPLRDMRKYRDMENLGKYDYVTNKNSIGFPRENYKIFVFQWVLDGVGDEHSLVPGPILVTLHASSENDTVTKRGVEVVKALLEKEQSGFDGMFLNEHNVAFLEGTLEALNS